MKNDRDHVLYLYGIAAAPARTSPSLRGVDGVTAVESIACSGLVCWVSRVDRKEFADELARNMENLDWLAEVSVRHQHVVAALGDSADILPARFGTVFLSQATLEADVAARKPVLLDDLARIRDCEEWGVKVFAKAAKPVLNSAPKSGREYLQAKAGLLRTRPERRPDPEVDGLIADLEKLAVEMTPGGSITGGQPGLQWQASLLLKRARRKQFQAMVERFSAESGESHRIECTGPWPPYSFVSRERRGAESS